MARNAIGGLAISVCQTWGDWKVMPQEQSWRIEWALVKTVVDDFTNRPSSCMKPCNNTKRPDSRLSVTYFQLPK